MLSKNYFFTPSPQPLHVRDRKVAALKPSLFQSEFTHGLERSSQGQLDRFDTNFQSGGSFGRLKKEIKTSDKEDTTYFQHGHHDNQDSKQAGDQVQLRIPDPLAPGHPQAWRIFLLL